MLILPTDPSSPSQSQFPQSVPVPPVSPSSSVASSFPRSVSVVPAVPGSRSWSLLLIPVSPSPSQSLPVHPSPSQFPTQPHRPAHPQSAPHLHNPTHHPPGHAHPLPSSIAHPFPSLSPPLSPSIPAPFPPNSPPLPLPLPAPSLPLPAPSLPLPAPSPPFPRPFPSLSPPLPLPFPPLPLPFPAPFPPFPRPLPLPLPAPFPPSPRPFPPNPRPPPRPRPRHGGPAAPRFPPVPPGPGRGRQRPPEPPEPPGASRAGPCWAAVLGCLSLACSYVGSLYVWGSPLPRDHPSVIKRRFTSVLVVSGLSPALVWLWKELTGVKADTPLPALLGLRLEGLVPATLLPLLLTMILFLGPLIQLSMDCPWRWLDGIRVALDPRVWALCLGDVRWLRNQVVAPLTEELVFRACMLPMLVPCTGPGPAVLACPLFFGVAHFHHVIEQLRFRHGSVGSIFMAAAFQFSYTAVFGAYTAFLFLRTGHLAGPVLCHSFCNSMGFPALGAALGHPRRRALLPAYLLGVLGFLLLLHPLTEPAFFGARPPCRDPPACS